MKVKYPKTYHLPWSLGINNDDRVLNDITIFEGKNVVATKKMDGENTTMYSDHIHARSLDSRGGIDRDWVKTLWSGIAHNIPENWRICGENLWAKHSIYYTDLPSYFLGFSIWDNLNNCLSWDNTLQYFDLLGIISVPVIYTGVWDEKKIKAIALDLDFEKDEGYVVRLADSFHFNDFDKSIAKYVRKGHVQTDQHWRTSGSFIPNKLMK